MTTHPVPALKPSDFKKIDVFKEYTANAFLSELEFYIDRVIEKGKLIGGTLDQTDKTRIMEMAEGLLDTRGYDLQSWILLQSHRLAGGADTPEALKNITNLSVAAFTRYAMIEMVDDYPQFDNDTVRRNGAAIWHKFGPASASVFEGVIHAFSNDAIRTTTLPAETRLDLIEGLDSATVNALHGLQFKQKISELTDAQSMEQVYKCHNTKVADFARYITRAGALSAGAEPDTVRMMEKIGVALGRAVQIANDTDFKDIYKDMGDQAPNIVAAHGQGRISVSGATRAQAEFKAHVAEIGALLEQPALQHPAFFKPTLTQIVEQYKQKNTALARRINQEELPYDPAKPLPKSVKHQEWRGYLQEPSSKEQSTAGNR